MRIQRIAVVGTGAVGTRLAEELISRGTPEIMLISRDQRRLWGVQYSLERFAFSINSRTHVVCGSIGEIRSTDLPVICAKDDYNPSEVLRSAKLPRWLKRTVRTASLFRDLKVFSDVFRGLRGFGGRVIVISNPVEVVTVLAARLIPSKSVVGLGASLDTMRLAFELSKLLGERWQPSDCPVGGIHGMSMVPFRSLWKSPPIGAAGEDRMRLALRRCARTGPRIVNALGFSVHDCAAVFANDIEGLLGRSGKGLILGAVSDGQGAVGSPLDLSETGEVTMLWNSLASGEIARLKILHKSTERLADKVLASECWRRIR